MGHKILEALILLALIAVPSAHAQQLAITQGGTVIDGRTISNPSGRCIEVAASNVTIKNSTIGPCGERGINIAPGMQGITISGNTIKQTAEHTILGWGNDATITNVSITGNIFRDVSGTLMLSRVGGNVRIADNVWDNVVGTHPGLEDMISINEAVTTAAAPTIIENNCLKGGGPSASGGGIMTGQMDGQNIVVRNNTLIDPGQYGIAVAGGKNIQVLNNKVYSSQRAWSNVGIYAWAQYGAACSGITVQGNQVDWTKSDGSKAPNWDSGSCGTVSGWSNNTWSASLSGMTCSSTPTPPASSCATPWGATVASGSSVTAYQAASVVAPAGCVAQTRTCTNGALSGSYAAQACSVTQPAGCKSVILTGIQYNDATSPAGTHLPKSRIVGQLCPQ